MLKILFLQGEKVYWCYSILFYYFLFCYCMLSLINYWIKHEWQNKNTFQMRCNQRSLFRVQIYGFMAIMHEKLLIYHCFKHEIVEHVVDAFIIPTRGAWLANVWWKSSMQKIWKIFNLVSPKMLVLCGINEVIYSTYGSILYYMVLCGSIWSFHR